MGGMRAFEWAVKYRRPRAARGCRSRAARRRPRNRSRCARCRSRSIEADPQFAGGDYYDVGGRAVARDVDRAWDRSGVVPVGARAGAALQPRSRERRAPVRRWSLHRRVVPRVPRREARAPVRRQHVYRAVAGHEPPRHRARSRRRGRRARARHGGGDDRRYLERLALPAAAAARARRSHSSQQGRRGRAARSAGHDGFLTEHEAIGEIIAGALV